MHPVSGRIYAERTRRGWSQRELGRRIFVHQVTVSHWESGKRLPDVVSLCALADVFGVTTDSLLGRSRPSSGSPRSPYAALWTDS